MPNRIIKHSAFESEKISALSDFDFRLWVGLITEADDAGRGDARPAILKGHLFPFRDRVTLKDIEASLLRLAAGSCISLYKVGGKSYYQFPTWAKHQRIYNAKTKVPGPEEASEEDKNENLPQAAASCGESPQAAASCRLYPNTNPNTNLNPNLNLNNSARSRDGESAEKIFCDFCLEMQADDGLYQSLCAFAAMRKQYKKPLNCNSASLLLKKLLEFPQKDWISVVNMSLEHGWMSFYGMDGRHGRKKSGYQKHGDKPSPVMLEAVNQMLEEDV